MRPQIEDVLNVLQEILTAYSASGSGHSVSGIRLEAVRKVATRELSAHRFSNCDSAEKSIHDACTRRLRSSSSAFDERVDRWLSGDPEELRAVLGTASGYSK